MKVETSNLNSLPHYLAVVGIRTLEIAVQVRCKSVIKASLRDLRDIHEYLLKILDIQEMYLGGLIDFLYLLRNYRPYLNIIYIVF